MRSVCVSVTTVLNVIYCDRLVPSGFLIIDDYGHWLHCKRAIDNFFDRQGWTPALMHSDYTGRWMQKPEKAPGRKAASRDA